MGHEKENPLSWEDRRKMADIVRVFIRSVDAEIVKHLRDMANHDRHLLSARIIIETSNTCDCSEVYELQEHRFTVEAEPVIHNAIVLGRCPCVHSDSDSGGPQVSFLLIHVATLLNRFQTIYFLLSLDESMLNSRSWNSEKTPFVIAAEKQDVDLMTYLMELGADVNIRDQEKLTPFLYAIEHGNLETLKLLVSCPECDLNSYFPYWHPVNVETIPNCLEMVKCLLKAGADPKKGLIGAVCREDLGLVCALIEGGAKIDLTTGNYVTRAVERGDAEICRIMLESGGNPNETFKGCPSISLAASTRKTEIVQLLLRFGADPNKTDNSGFTPLHHAAMRGYEKISKLLLDGGGKPGLRTRFGDTPLYLAVCRNRYTVVRLLLHHGCTFSNVDGNLSTVLVGAADGGCLETVRALVTAGADPNQKNMHNATPLWNAVFRGHVDVVRYLVQLNVDLSVPAYRGAYGQPETPLCVAVGKGFRDIVDILLEGGYDVWRERWLVKWIHVAPARTNDPHSLRIVSRLSVLYSSPPSLLHISKMFFRKRFKLQLSDAIKGFPLPDRLKDFLTLEGVRRRVQTWTYPAGTFFKTTWRKHIEENILSLGYGIRNLNTFGIVWSVGLVTGNGHHSQPT